MKKVIVLAIILGFIGHAAMSNAEKSISHHNARIAQIEAELR